MTQNAKNFTFFSKIFVVLCFALFFDKIFGENDVDMNEIVENCNRAAIFSEGKTVAIGEPHALFSDVERMRSLGLDVPFTAKIVEALKERNILIECDYTLADFVDKTLEFAQTEGVCTSSSEGGSEDA